MIIQGTDHQSGIHSVNLKAVSQLHLFFIFIIHFIDHLQTQRHLGGAVEEMHLKDGDAFAAIDAEDIALMTEEGTGGDADAVAFHIAHRDINDVVVIDKVGEEIFLMFGNRTVKVLHVEDDVEAGEPADVGGKVFDAVGFDEEIGGEKDQFGDMAFPFVIVTFESVGDGDTGIDRRIGIGVDHLPRFFFIAGVGPKNVEHDTRFIEE